MYNRYIPNGNTYTRVRQEEIGPTEPMPEESPSSIHRQSFEQGGWQRVENQPTKERVEKGGGFSLPEFFSRSGKQGGLAELLKSLKLDNLDSGDILLLLIVLFLLLEGDNLELVIALGLVLIMGLGEGENKQEGTAE